MLYILYCLLLAQEVAPLKVVANQLEPGPMRLELVEDLRFGPENGGEDYVWEDATSPVMVDADEMGNIYVMDPLSNRVLKFDPNGVFIDEIVSAGPGPGELGYLLSFRVAPNGRLFIFDAKDRQPKLLTYDEKHEYVFSYMAPQEGYVWVYLIFDGKLKSSMAVLRKNNFEAHTSVVRVVLLNEAFKVTHEFSRIDNDKETLWKDSKWWEQDYWERFCERWFRSQMKARWVGAFLSDASLVYTKAEDYSLERWSPDGKVLQMRITKEHQPIRLTLKERSEYVTYLWENERNGFPEYKRRHIKLSAIEKGVEAAEVGPYKKTIFGIIPMMDQHFLVVYDAGIFEDHFKAHIFNGEGECIGDTVFPARGVYPWVSRYGFRVIFKKDHVYTVEKNEDDENEVVRYRYQLVKR